MAYPNNDASGAQAVMVPAMKAMVLAAGRGSRMQALTVATPKPLIKVLDKPLIEYHLDNLETAGFSSVVVNVSWLSAQLEEYFRDQYRGSLEVSLYCERHALETGGGVYSALEELSEGGQPFLVINADIMCDFDFTKVSSSISGLAHLYMVENPVHNPTGDFYLDASGLLIDSEQSKAESKVTFSGISMLTPQLFAGCEKTKFSLGSLFRKYMGQGLISGERLPDKWIDVGTIERLALAKQWRLALQKQSNKIND